LRLCETQQSQPNVGFRSSTQPTRVKVFGQNLRSIERQGISPSEASGVDLGGSKTFCYQEEDFSNILLMES
jgi:hypothetical protein